jgi:hypothetical protein
MDPTLREWLELVVRWAHVVTGIAWIGASFYFNWLLNHLTSPEEDEDRVAGELWAIHAGGFFKVQKRKMDAGTLPAPLHWFKWEAYWTWITGFLLLVMIYYLGASVYLIDRSVADIEASPIYRPAWPSRSGSARLSLPGSPTTCFGARRWVKEFGLPAESRSCWSSQFPSGLPRSSAPGPPMSMSAPCWAP